MPTTRADYATPCANADRPNIVDSADDPARKLSRHVPRRDGAQTGDRAMREALDVAFKTAASEATILLRGESGAGKDVLARAIHARSPRAARPLVAVHCPGLSAELLESELFGHVQGGFPRCSAGYGRKGGLGGRRHPLLNEIGDLPAALQPKLLRLLQQRCYERMGETQTRASNVRVLAATNRNLEAELAAGRFLRRPLLPVERIEVTVPPLRDRPADILPLAEHLLRFYARQDGKSISGFAEPAREALLRIRLARKHPRAAQRHRTGSHSRGRPRCRAGRLAVADRQPVATEARAGRRTKPRAAERPLTLEQWRPSTSVARWPPRQRLATPRRSWASTPARCIGNGRSMESRPGYKCARHCRSLLPQPGRSSIREKVPRHSLPQKEKQTKQKVEMANRRKHLTA